MWTGIALRAVSLLSFVGFAGYTHQQSFEKNPFHGSIHCKGTADYEINKGLSNQISGTATIKADTQKDLERLKKSLMIDIKSKKATFGAYIHPGCLGCSVKFDIQAPAGTKVFAWHNTGRMVNKAGGSQWVWQNDGEMRQG